MHLFRSSSKKKETSVSPPAAGKAPSRSASLKSVKSAASIKTLPQIVTNGNGQPSSKNSSPTRMQTPDEASFQKIDEVVADIDKKFHISNGKSPIDSLQLPFPSAQAQSLKQKRISTIAETESDSEETGGSEFEDEKVNDEDSDEELDSDEESDDDEGHLHVIMGKKAAAISSMHSQFNSFMAYCGLTPSKMNEVANEESKRTFSLLDDKLKIFTVSSTTNRNDPKLHEPVINEQQAQLIKEITSKINNIVDLKDRKAQYELASQGKTVFERYGTAKKVIGRGAYGLIKILEPIEDGAAGAGAAAGATSYPPITKNRSDSVTSLKRRSSSFSRSKSISPPTPTASPPPAEQQHTYYNKKLYAVKELLRRGTPKEPEPTPKYIERVLSEFIISSTLNYKHIVKTVDLMITLPPVDAKEDFVKINQVMDCTLGGDLFSYMTMASDRFGHPVKRLSLDELDCFIKQIAKGLWYMHQHGVAHCDLKLENILIKYVAVEPNSDIEADTVHSKAVLKLSDFGKSNVFRTKWDKAPQLTTFATGPIGSEPYIAPEEYGNRWCNGVGGANKDGFWSWKKDNWALGVLILLMFNIKKHLYSQRGYGNGSAEDSGDSSGGYVWHSTEPKQHMLRKDKKFKDKNFDEYIVKRMVADYECKTKEWLIKREGTYGPIETLFDTHTADDSSIDDTDEEYDDVLDQDEKDLCNLRKMFIYKLLDPDPDTRLTVEEFLKSDWMRGVETCI